MFDSDITIFKKVKSGKGFMVKYYLHVKGVEVKVKADFLPRKGDVLVYNATDYQIREIRHETFKKGSRLETRVKVHVFV